MKDKIGREIKPGDIILYARTNSQSSEKLEPSIFVKFIERKYNKNNM